MIFDLIQNRDFYLKHPVFGEVFNEIYRYDHFADGKPSVQINDYIFIKRVVYNTIHSDWITESHRKYVDIQIVMEGEELVKVFTGIDLIIKSEYDIAEDVVFYNTQDALTKIYSTLHLRPGNMAIFLPQDVHMTQISTIPRSHYLKKIVIKVDVKYFQ